MPPPVQRSAVIGDRVLTWRERGSGDGAALVLIHGIGGSSESWLPVLDGISSGRRAIAWDAPGYGGSGLVAGTVPSTAASYADLLARLLRKEGVRTAYIVAHSIASPIAAELCLSGTVAVAGLVLVHPLAGFGALDAARRESLRSARLADIAGMTMAEFARVRAPQILGSAATPAVADEVARIIATIPEAGYRAMVEVMASADIAPALPRIEAPALVLAGEDDRIAPPQSCRAMADALPRARFASFAGIGHYLPLENPCLFLTVLENFLLENGPPG
jgi:pimeloyl-ACP methyl ester carboxylesterase